MKFRQKLVVYFILDYLLCAYRINILGSETFEGICFQKYSEGLRYC